MKSRFLQRWSELAVGGIRMPSQSPVVTDVHGSQFACFPVAVLVFIVDEDERILFLSHPEQRRAWQIVKGALEGGAWKN